MDDLRIVNAAAADYLCNIPKERWVDGFIPVYHWGMRSSNCVERSFAWLGSEIRAMGPISLIQVLEIVNINVFYNKIV
jgi:hypothetical protein